MKEEDFHVSSEVITTTSKYMEGEAYRREMCQPVSLSSPSVLIRISVLDIC